MFFHIFLAFTLILSHLENSFSEMASRKASSEQKIYIPLFTSQNSHYAAFKMARAAFERGEVTVLDFPNFSIVKKEEILSGGGYKLIYSAIHKKSGKEIDIAEGSVDKNGGIEKIESLFKTDSLDTLEKLLESGSESAVQAQKTPTVLTIEEANKLFEGAFPAPKPLYHRVLKMAWTVLGLGGLLAWVWFDPVSKILLGLIGGTHITTSIAATAGFMGMLALRGVIFVEVFGYIYHRFFQHLGFWTRRGYPIRISQNYHWKHHMILYPIGPSYIHESPYKGTEPGLGLSWLIPSIGAGVVSAVIMVAAMGLNIWSVIGAVVFVLCAGAYGAFVVSVTHARTHEKKHDLWYWAYFNWISDIHALHHWDQGYNYTIIHPAMDILFGTYLNPKRHLVELDLIKRMLATYEGEKGVIISDLINWRYLLLEATPVQYALFISNARAHSKSLRKMDALMGVLRKRLTSYPKDALASVLYQRGLALLAEIDNEKSRKLWAEYQPFSDQLPGEGTAFQKSGEALTLRQDVLVDEAIRSYFDIAVAARYGFKNEKSAEAYALLDAQIYNTLDPDEKLKAENTVIYVFDDLMFRLQRIAHVKQVGVPWGLITHPSTRFGAKLYMDLEHLEALRDLPEDARRQWAAHEAEHLKKPSASEDEIQKAAPVDILVKEFKKFDRRKVNQAIARLTSGDRFEKYIAMRSLRKYGKHAARAIPSIIDIAENEDDEKNNRMDAVDTLGVIGRHSPLAVQVLIRLKETEDPKTHLSKKVMLVLRQFSADTEELLKTFEEVLEANPRDDVLEAAVLALSRAGNFSDRSRMILVRFLADKENAKAFPRAYEGAVKAMGVLGPNTAEAVRALFGALEVRHRKINLAALTVLRHVLPGRVDFIKVITEAAESSSRATARSFAVELLRREKELPAETLQALERISGRLKEQGFTRKLARTLVHEAASRDPGPDDVKRTRKKNNAPFPELVITRSARGKYDLQGPLYQLIDGPGDVRQIHYSHPGMEAWMRNKGFYRHELVWLGVLHEARHDAIREVNDRYELMDELKQYLEDAFEGDQGLKNFLKSFYLEFPEGDLYRKILETNAGDETLEQLSQYYLNKSKMPESADARRVDQALEEMMSRPGGVELGVEEVLVRFLESRNQFLRNHPLLASEFYEKRAFRIAGEAIGHYFRDKAAQGVILNEGRFQGQPLGLALLEFAGTDAVETISIRDQLRNAHRAGFNLRGVNPDKVKASGGQNLALVSGGGRPMTIHRGSVLVQNAEEARNILSSATEWVSLVTESLPKGQITMTLKDAGIYAETRDLSNHLEQNVLQNWMAQLGLSRLILPQKEDVTFQEAVNLFNWLALAAAVSREDVFLGKAAYIKEVFDSRIGKSQSEYKEINVKAMTLAQIEQDFMDEGTRQMIGKELESGVRYVLIAEKGQKAEEVREKLARSNFDLKWLAAGKVIIINELNTETGSVDVDSVIAETLKAWSLDEKSFKAYVNDPENAEESSNFALAVPENIELTGNAQKVRYFKTRKGVRLSETLTLLHGLLTAPLRVVVEQMKEEFLAQGFSQDDIDALLSMEGDVLIPPIQSGSLVNRMVEERKAAEMISWSA